jgi:hypothetical protein
MKCERAHLERELGAVPVAKAIWQWLISVGRPLEAIPTALYHFLGLQFEPFGKERL